MAVVPEEIPLADVGKHPYELWYEKIGTLTDQISVPDEDKLWYPELVVISGFPPITASEQPAIQASLDTLLGVLLKVANTPGALIMLHEFVHLIYLWRQQGYQETEFVAFRQRGLSRAAFFGLFQELRDAGLTVKFSRSGAPLQRVGAEQTITAGELGFLIDKILDQQFNPAVQPGPDVPRPIVGVVIDHAVGFANDTFCKTEGGARRSRFAKFWMQEDELDDDTIEVGRVFDDAAINNAMDTQPTEADVYAALSGAPMVQSHLGGRGDSATHGTATGHVAFGSIPGEPEQTYDLLGVQLPELSVALTNGLLHDLYVKTALNWAVVEALQMYPGVWPRLFVNHSFGNYAGRHDGFGVLEGDFERRLGTGDLAMVTTAAGNGFQSATHAALTKEEIEDPQFESDLTLVVQPDNRATTFVQFWADVDAGLRPIFPVDITVTPPGGQPQVIRGIETGKVVYAKNPRDDLMNGIYCQLDDLTYVGSLGAPERRVLTLAIGPTALEGGSLGHAPAGNWKLSFTNATELSPGGSLAMWVERGDTPAGFRAYGRQSYFSHPAYERRDATTGDFPDVDTPGSPIRRFGTLAASATSAASTVVAAFRDSNHEMSEISAASSNLFPTRQGGHPVQPSLATAAEASAVRRNMLTTGTFTGSTRAMRGTSFAAPLAMRHAIAAVQGVVPELDLKQALLDLVAAGGLPHVDSRRAGRGLLPGRFESTNPRRGI
jgi:hypothetical protein